MVSCKDYGIGLRLQAIYKSLTNTNLTKEEREKLKKEAMKLEVELGWRDNLAPKDIK